MYHIKIGEEKHLLVSNYFFLHDRIRKYSSVEVFGNHIPAIFLG